MADSDPCGPWTIAISPGWSPFVAAVSPCNGYHLSVLQQMLQLAQDLRKVGLAPGALEDAVPQASSRTSKNDGTGMIKIEETQVINYGYFWL